MTDDFLYLTVSWPGPPKLFASCAAGESHFRKYDILRATLVPGNARFARCAADLVDKPFKEILPFFNLRYATHSVKDS